MRPLPPILLLICLALMAGLHFATPIDTLVPAPWNLSGIALVVFGIFVAASGVFVFKQAHTAIPPGKGKPTSLVTSGPYRFTRNPMYLGMLILLLGAAIIFGTVSTLFTLPIFVVCIELIWIRREERWMAEAFGDEYTEFMSGVRRWI